MIVMDCQRICGSFYQFAFICIFILILFQYESVTHWTPMWEGNRKIIALSQWDFVQNKNEPPQQKVDSLNKLLVEIESLTDKIKRETAMSKGNMDDYDVETVIEEPSNDAAKAYVEKADEVHYKDVSVVELDVDRPEGDHSNDAVKANAQKTDELHYKDVSVVDLDVEGDLGAYEDTDVVDVAELEKPESDTSSTLLLLFTSWAYSAEKLKVHETLLKLWSSWSFSSVRPLIMTNDDKAREMALASNWSALPITKKILACRGPPVLLNMFVDTMVKFDAFFYGYANADIVFGNGLVQTLKYLRRINHWEEKPLLVVGRRYNFDFSQSHIHLHNSTQVKGMLKNGRLVIRSTDYFFTNKAFPWKHIPMVSIGRPFVVRAVIAYAIKHHIDIIDATRTIESVHLTTEDGIYASWYKPGKNCNKNLLVKQRQRLPLGVGHCECARLETVRDKKGFLRLRSRRPSRTLCPGLK